MIEKYLVKNTSSNPKRKHQNKIVPWEMFVKKEFVNVFIEYIEKIKVSSSTSRQKHLVFKIYIKPFLKHSYLFFDEYLLGNNFSKSHTAKFSKIILDKDYTHLSNNLLEKLLNNRIKKMQNDKLNTKECISS